MDFLKRLFVNALTILACSYILPGIEVENFKIAIIVALLISFFNSVLKPILIFLTIPVTIITLGLFIIVINAAMILLADYLVNGFFVSGFIWAIIFSFILGFANSIFAKNKTKTIWHQNKTLIQTMLIC